jgi:hypothetical protein
MDADEYVQSYLLPQLALFGEVLGYAGGMGRGRDA